MRLVVFLLTIFFGKKAGKDKFGNIYYYSDSKIFSSQKRWIFYKGSKEASKVPDYWEVWLRHMSDAPLSEENQYSWQKQHLPNLTGTKLSNAIYHSKEHKGVNSYKPWKE